MSTVPKIFNVNSAKVSPTLPLMQFWEARKNNHYEYQWPLNITFWDCKTLLQIMIEILKICSPYPAMATQVYELMQFRTVHIAVCFFSRSNCFKSILKYILPFRSSGSSWIIQSMIRIRKQIPCGWRSYRLLCKWQYDSGCIIWSFNCFFFVWKFIR